MSGRRTAAWTPPEELEEYRLLRLLGRGAMGQVYLAHDNLLDRPVAIKFVTHYRDAAARGRFLTEARAAARLQHPNVVRVYRVGEVGDRPFIVSEFLRGQGLERVDKPMPWQRAVELGLGLVRGLAAAHRHGVLHRDVKPANAILTDDGDVVLVDFGLAKLADPSESVADQRRELPTLRPASGSDLAATSDGDATEDLGSAETIAPDRTVDSGAELASAGTVLVDAGSAETVASQPGELRLGPAAGTGARLSDGWVSPPTGSSITGHGAVMGTPYYMAPEAWRGEPATRRTDIYAAGVVLYELCAGRPPFRGVPVEELSTTVAEREPPPIGELASEIDPRLAAIIHRCLARDPADRFASGDELRAELERLVAPTAAAELPDGNPYRGLLPFEAEHRALFFGREAEVSTVIERTRGQGMVLVAGESGVGKSSLVRAGVLPRLAGGVLDRGRRWSTVSLVPGRAPVTALAAAIAERTGGDEGAIATAIADDPGAAGRLLRVHHAGDGATVLLIDQLEELVTLSDPEQAEIVARALARMVDPAPGLRVVATARADYLAPLAALPGLGDELARHLYLLPPMKREAMREVVTGPARAKGGRFESAELVDALVDSAAGPGGLPLLSFALAEMWDARDPDSGVITAATLESIGGVGGALARHADAALTEMMPAERAAARRILIRLVTLDGTRARRSRGELVAGDPAGERALERLIRARLLVVRESDGEATCEVAHEVLITGWQTLRDWLEDEAGTRAARERIAAAAAEWERLGRRRDTLFGPAQLAEAGAVDVGELAAAERDFLAASRRAAVTRRWVARGAILGIVAIAAIIYGVVRYQAGRDLDQKVDAHVRAGEQALAEARATAAETEQKRQRAFELFDAGETDQAEALWSEVGKAELVAQRHYARASQSFEAALRLDGDRDRARRELADILYERALAADRADRRDARDELLQRLAVYDDGGARRARWTEPARLTLAGEPDTKIRIDRFLDAQDGTLSRVTVRELAAAPSEPLSLEPGSYVIVASAEGRASTQFPVLLDRGEELSLELTLPTADTIPDGLIFVPAGRFIYGNPLWAEGMREFYVAAPAHPRNVDAFLIARHETTFGDWIEFLEALPPEEQQRRRPNAGSGGFHGRVELTRDPDGVWVVVIQPTQTERRARLGEPIVYPGRAKRAKQRWERMPVSGISWEDAEAYVAWLARTGRVPGARLCREDEWERAARGADDRLYPHGDRMDPGDANFDATYQRKQDNYGPDEVGSFPRSDSPFGVANLAGNVFEMTRSVVSEDEIVGRGGAYYYDAQTNTLTNRNVIERSFRNPITGFRICADPS